ncbi:MAG TPA: alcohol dehydrogenase catalytic domain-containing protein, partial [Alphaproteobacteria bacterium]|nr:alcohol dehydrogenase catalytic domain-containing protein [Alphaproteobacteria bacterium]
MRAMVLERPAAIEASPLVLRDVDPPAPAQDELLVRVRTCGVCRTDLHVTEGELPPKHPRIIPG